MLIVVNSRILDLMYVLVRPTARSVYDMVFSHLGFWSGNFFLIAPVPAHFLLVPFFAWVQLHVRV